MKYKAQKVNPEFLQDDELLPEIVNIWRHGAHGSGETGEGLFGFLDEQGHLNEIENVIREYCRRNNLQL